MDEVESLYLEKEWNDIIPFYKRYFRTFIPTDCNSEAYPIYMIHSNKIIMIAIETNQSFQVERIDIPCVKGDTIDYNKNIRGKKKHGCQYINKNQTICTLHMKCGSKIDIKSDIDGKIIEINTKVIDQPELLISKKYDGGYLMIVDNRKSASLIMEVMQEI